MTRNVSIGDFGLIIAYLLPGFAAMWGTGIVTGVVDWKDLVQGGPTLGGFLSGTVVSLAAGLTLSTLRWLLIDPLHHMTGIPPPERSFAQLQANVEAYSFLNDAHYRYYQHAAGMLLATAWVYAAARWMQPARPIGPVDLGVLALVVLYYLGSRDALKKFYQRTGQLLVVPPSSAPRPGERTPSGRH